MTAAKVSPDPRAIDAPEGSLYEWWSVFWDIFISRTNEKHSESGSANVQAQQTKTTEQQLQMQLVPHRSAKSKRRHPSYCALGIPINGMNFEGMTHTNSMDSKASPTLIDANRMALPKPATSHKDQLVHGNSGNMSTALEKIQARPSELDQRNTNLTLKGSPLTGIDHLRPSLGGQVQKPNLTNRNPSLLVSQQQQALPQAQAQAQAQNNYGNSTKCDIDPHRLSDLGRGSVSAKDGQAARNDGSTFQVQQTKARKRQHHLQQLELMRHHSAQLKRRHPNHSALGDSINGMNSEGVTHSNSMDSKASPTLTYANGMTFPKSATCHQGQLAHDNSGNMSTALEQIQVRPSGLNQGNTSLPLKGSPLTGIDQLRPSLGVQVQKPNLTNQKQSLLVSQQQQVLVQDQAQNNLGHSTKCDMDPHRLSDLDRGSLSAKDGLAARNDGSTSQAQRTKAREQQLQMQQLQLMRHHGAQLKRRHPNHAALGDSINGMNSKGMTHSNSMDSGASPTLICASRAALPKSATIHRCQLVHGNSGNMSTALEKIQARPLGLNQENASLPLKGSPLTQALAQAQAQAQNNLGNSTKCDMDPHRLSDLDRGSLSAKDGQAARNDRSICTQVLSGSPKMKMAQVQHFLSQQQEPLQQSNRKRKQHSSSGATDSTGSGSAVSPSPTSPPSTPTPGDGIDTTSSMQNVDRVQGTMMMNGIEGTGSLASSPLSLMKMAQAQHSLSQQQNNRKRKQTSSGAANSTGTGNAVSPSPNSPPSTAIPHDGIDTRSSMQHVGSVQATMMMNGIEGTGNPESFPISLDHLELFTDFDFSDEQFGDVDTLGFDVESLNDGEDGGNLYGTTEQCHPAEQQKETSKGSS